MSFMPSTTHASLTFASLPVPGHAVTGILLTPKHSLPRRQVSRVECSFCEAAAVEGDDLGTWANPAPDAQTLTAINHRDFMFGSKVTQRLRLF